MKLNLGSSSLEPELLLQGEPRLQGTGMVARSAGEERAETVRALNSSKNHQEKLLF